MPDLDTYVRFALALAFVLALAGLAAMLLRRFGMGGPHPKRGRRRRLDITEVIPVDARRRLVLVRRDDVEHLLLLGHTQDLVVETGIAAAGAETLDATQGENRA